MAVTKQRNEEKKITGGNTLGLAEAQPKKEDPGLCSTRGD
jgi:hypothetical protein